MKVGHSESCGKRLETGNELNTYLSPTKNNKKGGHLCDQAVFAVAENKGFHLRVCYRRTDLRIGTASDGAVYVSGALGNGCKNGGAVYSHFYRGSAYRFKAF